MFIIRGTEKYLFDDLAYPNYKEVYLLTLQCKFYCFFPVKISLTGQQIEFSILGNLYKCPGVVLAYFIFKFWDGFRIFCAPSSSFKYRVPICYGMDATASKQCTVPNIWKIIKIK